MDHAWLLLDFPVHLQPNVDSKSDFPALGGGKPPAAPAAAAAAAAPEEETKA